MRKQRRAGLGGTLLRSAARLMALAVFGSVAATLVLRWIPPITSSLMLQRSAQAWLAGERLALEYRWTPLDRIAPEAAVAVIAAEDQKFARHAGFDLDSISTAWADYETGLPLRGASTISQQVAKNLFLWPGRSFVRKGLEAYFTIVIEQLWPKRRILEVYLNIAELGEGIFGVEAGSRHFFDKPAAQLDAEEAALLAAVLPNPHRFSAGRPSAYVLERRAWILTQMRQLGGRAYIEGL